MIGRQIWVRSGLVAALLFCALLSAEEAQVALPPDAEEELKASADYHWVVRVEAIDLIGEPLDPALGQLSDCRLEGTLVEVLRGDDSGVAGQEVTIAVDCWRHGQEPEPTGTSRVYYDDPGLPYTQEMWISRRGEDLVALFY